MKILLPLFIFLLACSCGNDAPKQEKTVSDSNPVPLTLADTSSPQGITFHISDVKPAQSLLPVEDIRFSIEKRIGKNLYAWPKEQDSLSIVPANMNGFIETVQYCFDEHRPLAISPDAVWLLICQGFSIHLNENFDSLKTLVFKNEKPVDIIVRNDSLNTGKAAEWQKLISGLSVQTQSYTKSDVYGTVVQNFSTTTAIERTAFEITLLESQKKAFNYIGESGCGIPDITLKGKISDWQKILDSLENFRRYGMDEWVDNLNPILKQFVAARKGDIDTAFWNGLYKSYSEYGAEYTSGWILKFFPYVKEYYTQGDLRSFRYVKNKFLKGDDYCFSTLSTENFPSGYAKVDLKWDDFGNEKDMELCSGFFGIRQYGKTKTLEPVISWAVFEKNAKSVTRDYDRRYATDLIHQPYRWLPSVETEVLSQPVYASCKTVEESKNQITKFLQDTLTALGKSKGFTPEDINVNFVVTWSGTITHIETGNDKTESPFKKEIQACLAAVPGRWKPAIKTVQYEDSRQESEATRVNYRIGLKLDF